MNLSSSWKKTVEKTVGVMHHIMEAIFKATAKALDQASMLEERLVWKVLSTKGLL